MNNLLVIGYGNTIRGDDGAGPAAAKALRDLYPEMDCIAVHGLEPVLAETIGHYDIVVFIDAAVGIDRMSFSALTINGGHGPAGTHTQSPESLLRLSRDLYNKTPQAVIVRIPAFQTGFGETLSAGTESAVAQCIDEFVRRFGQSSVSW